MSEKPREAWVYRHKDSLKAEIFFDKLDGIFMCIGKWTFCYHFIEKSAYDELQQWCDRFENFIKRDWKTDNKIDISKEALKLFEDYQDFKSRQGGEK